MGKSLATWAFSDMVTDRSPIDSYTLAHALFGMIARRQGMSTVNILLISILYELIEDRLISGGLHEVGWKPEPKSNALIDILAAYAGSQIP